MRQALRSIGFITIILWSMAAHALTFPALTGRVVDDAHVLSPATIQTLDAELAAHEQATTNQIVVVTLPSLQNVPIEDFGYQLGREWGIGQKGKNNGVLLIFAPHERKVRIEVGYGLEDTLTDAICSQIIRQIIPHLKQNDFNAAANEGVSALEFTLAPNASTPSPSSSNDYVQWKDISFDDVFPILFSILFGIIIVISLLGAFSRRNSSGSSSGSSSSDSGISSGSSSSSSDDNDDFSGGGGSFGGGGSSGSY